MKRGWGREAEGIAALLILSVVMAACARGSCNSNSVKARGEAIPLERSDKEEFHTAFEVLRKATQEGKIPGAVGAIVTSQGVVDWRAYGYRCLDPVRLPMKRDTVFDLASLTKMVATTTSLCILLERGQIRLDDPVSRFLPEFDRPDKKDLQVRHLITHTSGLTWRPFFKTRKGRQEFLEAIAETPLPSPPGEKHAYGDPNFITLGLIIGRITGQTLDVFAKENVFRPLGMRHTGFRPGRATWKQCAATEACPWRQKVMWGEVHDENAYAIGGVAGHAGLFSTADDLARYCQMILRGGERDGVRILSPETIAEFSRSQTDLPGANQGLGWRIMNAKDSIAGPLFSPDSFGHTGFTGTSICFDLERQVASILLTNRVHPSRDNQSINSLRRDFNTAVIEASDRSLGFSIERQ